MNHNCTNIKDKVRYEKGTFFHVLYLCLKNSNQFSLNDRTMNVSPTGKCKLYRLAKMLLTVWVYFDKLSCDAAVLEKKQLITFIITSYLLVTSL